MTQRWLHAVLRLFPNSIQSDRHAEMVDALAEVGVGRRVVLRETRSLVWAALVAWRIHLHTAKGVRESLQVGAVMWFGLLVGLGPLTRFGGSLDNQSWQAGRSGDASDHAVAGLLLLTALLVAAWRRGPAVLIVAPAILVAANANRVGEWQMAESLFYELAWLGLSFGLVLATWQRHRVGLALMGAGFAIATAFYMLETLGWSSTYGFTLGQVPGPSFLTHSGTYMQWVPVVLVGLLLLVPWIYPGLVAFAVPGLVHVTVFQPRLSVLVLVYVAVAVVTSRLLRRTQILTRFQRPRRSS